MELAELTGLVTEVHEVGHDCRDRQRLTAGLANLRRLRGWIDSREASIAAQLADLSAFPEQAVAEPTRSSQRDARRVLDRHATATAMPELAKAFDDGLVRGEHLDIVGRAARPLTPAQRERLAGRAEHLAGVAAKSSPEEFAVVVRREVARIEADDGRSRLERQRRASRLRTWLEADTGMWRLSGAFDPETGLILASRLRAMVATLFADTEPADCPSDPSEKQDYLRALALVALTEDKGGMSTRPEIIVVVDTTVTAPAEPDAATRADSGPVVDWGLPVDLPVDVLTRWYAAADTHTVVLCNGAVIHAPGRLDLGRTTRIANRAQRRALRACTPPVRCRAVGCGSTTARSTTSTGGATADPPTYTTSSPSVFSITPRSTTRDGTSPSRPTGSSPSTYPTAPDSPPDPRNDKPHETWSTRRERRDERGWRVPGGSVGGRHRIQGRPPTDLACSRLGQGASGCLDAQCSRSPPRPTVVTG
jgi:hypothetical protein